MRATPSVMRPRVPPGAVLVGQGDQLAVGTAAGGPTGVGQQHEGQEAGELGVLGQGGVQDPGEADGFAGEVGAGHVGPAVAGVALVEQQVEDMEHQAQPGPPLLG